MKTELIPVIHILNERQALTNVETCLANNIVKVFLINHAVSDSDLLECANHIKQKYPSLWVGVNRLGVSTVNAVNTELSGIDGLWCDGTLTVENAEKYRKFAGLFFGGLAFKYQPQPTDLQIACEEAKLATDVATTSGIGTGHAADVQKINEIRSFLGDHPMAIASGVSAENVDNYKGIANYLLVATSITDRNELIINEKLAELKSKLD